MKRQLVHVGIVGPYMSGKTTLCNMLEAINRGYGRLADIDHVDFSSVCATIGCSSTTFRSMTSNRDFQLIDTPGLERFKCITMPSLRNCELLVVCQRLKDRGKVDYFSKNSDALRDFLEYSGGKCEKVLYVYTCSDEVNTPKDYDNELDTSIFDKSTFEVLLAVLMIEVDKVVFAGNPDPVPVELVKVPEKKKGCC